MHILNRVSLKYKLRCRAALRHDMAKRIMYSILPAVADPMQVKHTEGVVDYKALEYAIEGYDKIIDYGLLACNEEIKHYLPSKSSPDYKEEIRKLISTKKYEDAAKLCIKLFEDKGGWETNYGGEAWKKIAETLYDMILISDALKRPGSQDHKINLMKQMVVELNIFDGLSHNTSAVLPNLIEIEEKLLGAHTTIENDEVSKTNRLMDAKELSDYMDVYKEVEPHLQESGDIHKFKDWNTKLRTDPRYHKSNENRKIDLIKIRLKKEILGLKRINDIYGFLDNMKKEYAENMKKEEKDKEHISTYKIRLFINSVRELINKERRKYPLHSIEDDFLHKIEEKFLLLYSDFKDKNHNFVLYEGNESTVFNELIESINRIMFWLDATF